ncbi:hypothetical protein JK358_26440 [Nocardia sp. 2]|uniref:Uncharacterized protein n=1 Tax=Nocardia acididurans TaxID=2802282 RepID=A0ABS1MFH3_9NOCA|nr:hypothetical protein [Nocardia acididurans]MBL1077948.1 hypothetical protein [Nocardia acididurans]
MTGPKSFSAPSPESSAPPHNPLRRNRTHHTLFPPPAKPAAPQQIAESNAKARVAALNGRVIPTTSIVAQTLESDWLVEIEAIAAA